MSAKMAHELEFTFEKETKNTYRFTEVAKGLKMIGTIYIQKWVFDEKAPDRIKITLNSE